MGDNRTVLKKGRPKYAIHSYAYSRASATRGYLEPVHIVGVEFDPAMNGWVYTWAIDRTGNKLSPVKIAEDNLLSECEALEIQLSVLKRQLAGLQSQYATSCPDGFPAQPSGVTYDKNGKVLPPAPVYGANEVVYLRESAESVGRLEAVRLSDMKWADGEWLYRVEIHRRPERNHTVGDSITMQRDYEVSYMESELCSLCEALYLAMQFTTGVVNFTQKKLEKCTATGT